MTRPSWCVHPPRSGCPTCFGEGEVKMDQTYYCACMGDPLETGFVWTADHRRKVKISDGGQMSALMSIVTMFVAQHPNNLNAQRVLTRMVNGLSLTKAHRRWLREMIDYNDRNLDPELRADCLAELDALAAKDGRA